VRPVRILVFAKAPLPGLAKTRLIPALGADGAAALARRMLDDTLAAVLAADVGPVELCATPAVDAPAWGGVAIPSGVATSDQGAGDLGARLARATARTCARGEAAILVGTDCPGLRPSLLRTAAAVLGTGCCVIHPTADGGYALLGLTAFDASLFDGIAWGGDGVAAATLGRLAALGWPVHVGEHLHDIDTPADLAWLPVGPA